MTATTTNAPPARTPLAKLPLSQVRDVKTLLANEQALGQLRKVAAKHMNPERMMRVLANAIRTTPALQEAEPLSMLGALMNCAALGLEPNTQLGHAYLVPFKNKRKRITEVQLIIGYKGFIDLARRSGQIRSIHADVVYDDDEAWGFSFGLNFTLEHKPGPRKGQKTHAYCYVHTADAGFSFVVLPWDQIMAIRDASQGWRSAVEFGKTAKSPWTTHEDRMAAKTAVRALANSGEMPLSIEFMEAMDADDAPANFADFALNPDDGLTIEGEATEETDHDPETGEVTEGEQEPEPKQTATRAAPKKEAAPAREAAPAPSTKAAAKPATKPAAKQSTAPGLPLDDPARERLAKHRDRIINEFVDADVEDVLEANIDVLLQMQDDAPDLRKDVQDVAAEYRAQRDAQDDGGEK